MKGKLAFLLGMALGQCFVWGCGEFKSLGKVFEWWQGRSGWDSAFKETQRFAEKAANMTDERGGYNCIGDDLKAIRAFAVSFSSLKFSLKSSEFLKYDAWLKNLCLIAYNIALQKNPFARSDLEGLPKQLSDNSIKDLCENTKFLDCIKRVGRILSDAINWGEEE